MHLFNSKYYNEVLANSKGHKGVKLNVDGYNYWGECAQEHWDLLGLFKRVVFYDMPEYIDNTHDLNLLLGKAMNLNAMFIQLRPVSFVPARVESILMDLGFSREDHLSAIIPITDPDIMWKNLERDKRKGVNRAKERYMLNIIESSENSDIVEFYSILSELYRKIRHPLKDFSYFKALFDYLPKDSIKLFLCKDGDRTIAGQIALFWEDRITALYTATGSDHINKHAGDLLIWHMLLKGFESGYQVFDFGGGGDPNVDYKPRDYKKRFGTIFENVGRYAYSKRFYYKLIREVYHLRLKS